MIADAILAWKLILGMYDGESAILQGHDESRDLPAVQHQVSAQHPKHSCPCILLLH